MFLKFILVFFLLCNFSFAKIIEEIIEVPVSVSNSNYANNPKFEQNTKKLKFEDYYYNYKSYMNLVSSEELENII
jgi:hypothetical protein